MSIPKAVQAARKARKLHVKDVAAAADVHVTHLMHFEAERKWMSRAKLERLLAVLGLELVDGGNHVVSVGVDGSDADTSPLSDASNGPPLSDEPTPVSAA